VLLQSTQRVLLCLRYGIGDVVMEMPALDALRAFVPAARITVLGARPALELLENDPRVDECVCVQDWGLHHWGDLGTPDIKQMIRNWLTRKNFDVILDPYHAVIAVRDVLWEQRTIILDTGKEAQDRALVDHAGGVAAIRAASSRCWGLAECGDGRPRLHLHAQDLSFARRFLAAHGLDDRPPVALSPVASSPLKRWPVERLAVVADQVIEQYGKLLLFYGPQSKVGSEFLRAIRHAEQIVSVGGMHLRKVAALLSGCAAVVGNDTGLMHITAAVGTPMIAIFGPTCPNIYSPPAAAAVKANIDCPYRKTTEFGPPNCVLANRCLIDRQSCINKVDVDAVMKAIQATLRSNSTLGKCS
jgi:heptosyltransferase-1